MTTLTLARLVRLAAAPAATIALSLASITAPAAHAQTAYSGCGTLIQGVTCPMLYQAGESGLVWQLSNYGSFQVGDFVRVNGTLDPSCTTFCQQGGCIVANTIDVCEVCVCTPFCAGDGSGAACPCGNNGLAGRGCANSVDPSGARLVASGNAGLSNDTLVLAGDGMPNTSALYFQGTSGEGAGGGVPFGDGKRCAGGAVVRLGTKLNSGGASQYPSVGDPSVSVRGLIGVPGVRTYQIWYRNAAAYCTPSTFNLSNGFHIVWFA